MRLSRALVLTAALAACSTDPDSASRQLPLAPPSENRAGGFDNHPAGGQVWTMTNDAGGNAVLAFARAHDGTLTPAGSYPTGGLGGGAGLGNQSGMTLDDAGRFLLVVNAGSNSVSSFRVRNNGGLDLVDVQGSGGTHPISVTTRRGIVYVLNDGGSGNIAGFRMSPHGSLSPIAGSSRPLSTSSAGPAQIGFGAFGRRLVVTEKANNALSTYTVDFRGRASGPVTTPSNGATPFGFAFTRYDVLIVSEAFGGAADASAVSSYAPRAHEGWSVVSGSVPTTETAACWIAITDDGRFAYTTNAGSGTISGYAIHHGALALLDADGVTGNVGGGSAPIDMALSRGSRFLYTLASGTHAIAGFRVGNDGSLTSLTGGASGLPGAANGLAAR